MGLPRLIARKINTSQASSRKIASYLFFFPVFLFSSRIVLFCSCSLDCFPRSRGQCIINISCFRLSCISYFSARNRSIPVSLPIALFVPRNQSTLCSPFIFLARVHGEAVFRFLVDLVALASCIVLLYFCKLLPWFGLIVAVVADYSI